MGSNLVFSALSASDDNSDHYNQMRGGFRGYGLGANVGYRFHPDGVALEGGLIYNHVKVSRKAELTNRTAKGDISVYSPYLAARWDLSIADNFMFIPKIGLMYSHADAKDLSANDDSTTDKIKSEGISLLLPFVGLGFGYKINQQVTLTVQYQGAIYGVLNAGLFSAGLDYHF